MTPRERAAATAVNIEERLRGVLVINQFGTDLMVMVIARAIKEAEEARQKKDAEIAWDLQKKVDGEQTIGNTILRSK